MEFNTQWWEDLRRTSAETANIKRPDTWTL